jgi:HEAT repeat protein
MMYHPKPELRASVIALIRERTDIDPIVWLLELSRDSDASVRARAVDALAGRLSPEVRRRLAEMAKSDQSPEVRQAASKIVPPNSEKTVALPPLPGSPSLNPKAN